MRHGRPIQHARHLPHGVAGAVARDVDHGGDKLVIPDAAIIRPGYGAAFHGADLCAFDAAANRIIKIGQAEITFIIGTRKPFRRYAANTLATRYVHAESVGNRLLGLGQAHYVHGSFSYWAWLEAQRCAATLPVGETGVARARAAGCGGGSPARRGAQNARLHAPGADVVVQNSSTARKTGDTAPAGTDRSVLYPCPREGGALPCPFASKKM